MSGSDRPQDPVVLGRDGVLSCLGVARNAGVTTSVYAQSRSTRGSIADGGSVMQISRPRDLGPAILVIGIFLILLVVTLTVGTPQR